MISLGVDIVCRNKNKPVSAGAAIFVCRSVSEMRMMRNHSAQLYVVKTAQFRTLKVAWKLRSGRVSSMWLTGQVTLTFERFGEILFTFIHPYSLYSSCTNLI